MLTDVLRQQVAALASIPVSTARLLAALADAAEVSVQVLHRLDERAESTNRVLHSFEDPLVRLAEAVDGTLVDSTVDALRRLPGLIAGLEAPVRALGPLSQAIDVTRLGGLVTRIEETLPGLVRIPEAETEVRRLRETLDRMYRVVDEVQGRFGALPGAGLLLRQRDTDVPVPGGTGHAPEGNAARPRGRNRTAERTEKGENP